MTQKVHCEKCDLYLGTSNEEDFPIQITCPVCEETHEKMRARLLNLPEPEPSRWFSDAYRSNAEGRNAVYMVQLMQEDRVEQVYEFPVKNGALP